jgi:hypothetical protein
MSTQHRIFTGIPLFAKRSLNTREPYTAKRPAARALSQHLIIPEVLRNQQVFGSCVGQAVGFAVSRADFVASGPFLWIEGRRVDLDLSGVDEGTTFESVFSVLENTGAAPYDPRENDPTQENWDRARLGPHLVATMAAADHKAELKVTAIDPKAHNAFELVCDAIASRARVVFSSGLRDAFFDLAAGEIATPWHLGSEDNGHAQAFCGFDRRAGELFALNSWGCFAGLHLPKETWTYPAAWHGVRERRDVWELPGAYRMTASTLAELWDIYVVEVT